jgi:hypothetical protein
MNFGNFPLVFSPLFPWQLIAGLGLFTVFPCIFAIIRRARGAAWRLAGFLLLLSALANPQWSTRTTRPLPDIALVLVDQSQSMQIGNRTAMATRALSALQATAQNTQLKIVDIPPADSGGTTLAPALTQALAGIDPTQLAGIILITDGEISDPAALAHHLPVTALLTANGNETDRELRLLNAPSYGLVGQNQTLSLQVIDHGLTDAGASINLSVAEDGAQITSAPITIGQTETISLPIRHPGPAIITASVASLPGEISTINNQAAFTLNGIHKRLNVLLISGRPDQGERAWRLLLKSDPAVQLVHFTILRTPGEIIDADPKDVALVPFPVRGLFETDIGKFDLIILDDFDANGLLPPEYLGNIANFVEQGGALLTEVGPEFSGPDSLAFSPLAPVLPAIPADPGTVTQSFAPALTLLGQRHPVTAPFAGLALPVWYQQQAATPISGDVLMSGANNLPLLILSNAARGRSALLLSDQLWLWTRGGNHEGPALPVLRRIVHWLLREPALESETLTSNITNQQLNVARQTLAFNYPGDATITSPDGKTYKLSLTQTAPGKFTGRIAAAATGVWKITESGLTSFAAAQSANTEEYQNLAATDENLKGVTSKIIWLGQQPAPALATLLSPRHAVQTTGSRSQPLLPPLPGILLALLLLAASWWRESGTRR